MGHNVHPLNFDPTINTWNKDIGTHCLMLLDILADAFSLAFSKSFAFDGSILAQGVVFFYLLIGKNLLAA